MNKYQYFIGTIEPNSFNNGFNKPSCPLNKEHKVYPKKYHFSYFKETGSIYYPIQYYCVDCKSSFTVLDNSFMKHCIIPRYIVFKIIMSDDDTPARILAEEYDLSINTIYRYRRKYKEEAILLKHFIDDNNINTFIELKEAYHNGLVKRYEELKGIKMPMIKD